MNTQDMIEYHYAEESRRKGRQVQPTRKPQKPQSTQPTRQPQKPTTKKQIQPTRKPIMIEKDPSKPQ